MFEKIEPRLAYVCGLVSSTFRKNCESLGRFLGLSGDRMLRTLNAAPATSGELFELAAEFLNSKSAYLIIDDTLIEKMYSRLIAGTSDNYDSSGNMVYRSLCAVVAMVTDGKWAIPVDHLLWVNKELLEEGEYRKKTDLAKLLILAVIREMPIKIVILDGLYASVDLIQWLNERSIKFEMRIHSNRVITVGDKTLRIDLFFAGLMNGKKQYRTVGGSWRSISGLYFTAVKRENRNGENQVVYQVSNYEAEPRKHVQVYGYRWNIEKFFRTAKQHLGLKDCQSRSRQTQSNHLMNVFLAYTLLIFECREKKLKNPEAVLARRKGKRDPSWALRFIRPARIFKGFYA